jgi:hypothetical protein
MMSSISRSAAWLFTDADIAKEKVVMAEQIIAPTKLDYAEDPK